MIGSALSEIDTPALVVNLPAFERNLTRMANLVGGGGARLRPHAKSHKIPHIAELQIALGAVGICCAKLGEAEVMAAGGIGDILITSPVVGRGKIARLAQMARATNVSVVVDSVENLGDLDAAAGAAGTTIGVLVEVDVGQNRCGVRHPEDAAAAAVAIERCAHLRFRGLQGYHGALQQVRAHGERRALVASALDVLQEAAAAVVAAGVEVEILTGGGTGSAPIDLELGGLNELQPGSYIFMDASYEKVAADATSAVAVFEPSLHVLTTIVSRPTPDLAVVDAGWKALSSDAGLPVVVEPIAESFTFGGDEHGKIVLNPEGRSLRLGDRVTIRPSHCDTTLNLYDRLIGARDGRVEIVWAIAARGRTD